jgi:hypothetical protein
MAETWLKPNLRVLWLELIAQAVFAAVGVAAIEHFRANVWVCGLATLLLLVALVRSARLISLLRQPRLAYHDGKLLVYLRSGQPIAVPIDVVECFFLGQAPSLLPGKQHEQTDAAAVVVRLAEAAREWSERQVKPALGKWCESYITIRGTWCEKLDLDKVNGLNRRLVEARRELEQARTAK